MLKFFSLPILIGITLGAWFPYQSLSLIWISSILLFLLLFLNTLAVEPSEALKAARENPVFLAVTLFFVYLFFPLMIAAASRLFLKDQDFAFGMVASAAAPGALVNPFFAKLRGGDGPLSLVMVLLTTLICPFLTVPLLHIFGYQSVFIDPRYIVIYLTLLTVLPVTASFAFGKYIGRAKIASLLPYFNSFILAALMFILVGSSLSRVPFRFLAQGDLPALIIFFLAADFGFYFLAQLSASLFANSRRAETFALAVSSRNFAVTASLMLFFHPKAALPAAIGLMVHALFFQFLTLKKSRHLAMMGLVVLTGFKTDHAFAKTPFLRPVTICLPPYGEVLGTAAVFAAADLGYFSRRGMSAEIKISPPSSGCDAGLASVDQLEKLEPSEMAKIQPSYFLVSGEGGAPRLIAKSKSAAATLAGRNIRVRSLAEAQLLKVHFRRTGRPEPVTVVEPDPSRAVADLRTGRLDAGIFDDPIAGAMLASKEFVSRPLPVQGLNTLKDLRTPSAVFYVRARGVSSPLANPFGEAFHYLDANPAQTFDFERRHKPLMNWQNEIDFKFEAAYSGLYFSWPQIHAVSGKQNEREIAVLSGTAPKTARWLGRKL